MTELTDEAVTALLAHYDLPTDCDCDGDDCVKCSHYPTFQERASKQLKDAAPDLARALLDARAELAAVEALRVEARENAMQALASMGQAQEAYEAQLEAEAELARVRAERDCLAAENQRLRGRARTTKGEEG